MTESMANLAEDLSSILTRVQNVNVEEISKDASARADETKSYTSIAARNAVDLNLFEHISSAPTPISSEELSALTNAESLLISRILRLLASVRFVNEAGEDRWTANETTRAMASPPIAAGHWITKYKVPLEPNDGFVQYGLQTKLNIFDYMYSIPPLLQDFNLCMGNAHGERESWHYCPVVLVDVGGGKGHDMQAFHSAFQEKISKEQGTLVLEDLPQVLDAIPNDNLPSSIVKMPHDFFTEQPVKGARGYLVHHILHDWPEKYCHQILAHLRKAMIPDYSKLLIYELILPNTGAVEMQARYDLVMMTFSGGMERSRSQWIKLLEDAGFCNIGFMST
ncbi:S-adenosyl-L-methionine-dependent methyltransferase [Bimuria novae-zelandiae CBS 107.79]|uniref:S-adenosyl-L-methionine-dependent methyltransferase n=1 Tax=Bimuria novae-zelandiae CBS 107.79 TaxID=1447943 RepID=A0A6A5UKZ1_9PLEO|nr:S-adenosyl-L-methionine-dependent methyltransferase [Bimuria novae-zelandiae CBS 107.79]